jgi:hypothetical protein
MTSVRAIGSSAARRLDRSSTCQVSLPQKKSTHTLVSTITVVFGSRRGFCATPPCRGARASTRGLAARPAPVTPGRPSLSWSSFRRRHAPAREARPRCRCRCARHHVHICGGDYVCIHGPAPISCRITRWRRSKAKLQPPLMIIVVAAPTYLGPATRVGLRSRPGPPAMASTPEPPSSRSAPPPPKSRSSPTPPNR